MRGHVGQCAPRKSILSIFGRCRQKDFELILVLATQGWRLGERLGWEMSAEEISTGLWEARMHQR